MDTEIISKTKIKLVPELRFKEFGKEWIELSNKEIFLNSRKKGNSKLPIYSVTLKREMVPRNSLNRKTENAAIATDNLFVAKNDIAYNMMRMWQGAFGLAPEDCMVSPAYIVLRAKPKFSSEFFSFYFNRARSLYLFTAFSYGLTKDRLRLYYKDFGRIKFATPNFVEQHKITSFLSSVDKKIQQLNRKKELLEEYKKGVMQKLFSQEIRFKDENGNDFPEWIEKKLEEIATFSKGKGISKNDISEDGLLSCIRYGELYTHYNETIEHTISKTNIPAEDLILNKAGDVIIPASGETRLDIATASCVIQEGIALGGDLNIIRGNFNGVFLAYFLNNHLKTDIARLSQGSSVIHLYSSQLKQLKLVIPSIQEQQKIANFLSGIDSKIENVSAQIEKTKTFKKGLLQQMFV